MAIYNEILSPRFSRAMQRLFSMKGGAPTKQLAGELMAVLPVFYGAECRFLEAWERFGAHANVAAVAAQSSNWKIRNPGGSNIIGVIEKLLIVTTVADTPVFSIGSDTADFGTVIAQTPRLDNRQRQNPTLIVSDTNNAAAVGQNFFVPATLANQSFDVIITDIQEITLLPGDSLNIVTTAVNLGLRVNCIWRERGMEESELRK